MSQGPSRVGSFLKTVLRIVLGFFKIFYWEELRDGFIDFRALGRFARVLTTIGLVLVVAFLAGILAKGLLRTQSMLEPIGFGQNAARGLLVPGVAVPITAIAMMLAWTYVLVGALRVRTSVRWLIVLAYLVYGFFGPLDGIIGIPSSNGLMHPILIVVCMILLLLLLLIAFLVLPRRPRSLGLDFLIILLLNGSIFLLPFIHTAFAQRYTGFPYVTGYFLDMSARFGQLITLPFLVITGLEMAEFGVDVSGWAAKSVSRHATTGIAAGLLIIWLIIRWIGMGITLSEGVDSSKLLAWTGAVLLVAVIGALFLWMRRKAEIPPLPDGLLWIVITILCLPPMVSGPLLNLVAVGFFIVAIAGQLTGTMNLQEASGYAMNAISTIGGIHVYYRQVFPIVAMAAGIVIALIYWRKRNATAMGFGLLVAWYQLLTWLTGSGHVLSQLRFEHSDIDAILLVAITFVSIYWLVRRRMTTDRAVRLLGLGVLMWILSQVSFLDNPFSPVFGFAGVALLVMGMLWDVLTIGGRFANFGTASFPRNSRVLLYLGYSILTVVLAHWYIISHDVDRQIAQDDLVNRGFFLYGLAWAYLVVVQSGRPLIEEDED